MSWRTRENLNGHNDAARDYVREKTELTGEYIDQFTTVPDNRTIDEILNRVPKCCIGHTPQPSKPLKLKPATKKDTSRVMQKHRRDE